MKTEEQLLFKAFTENANTAKAAEMAAYMRDMFPFLGIPKPLLGQLSKEFLRNQKKQGRINWDFIDQCYALPEREYQYLAIDYLLMMNDFLQEGDIDRVEQLIITRSWWDTVDALDGAVGILCEKFPSLKRSKIEGWISCGNIWLQRVSIDFQLQYHDRTDRDFLAKAILGNNGTGEFFIDKAIGWALRQFSKIDPAWVKSFLADHELSKLSIREASKYL